MEKEEKMENKTYEFIGRLALVLFSQNMKMSFDTLIGLLKDNGFDEYKSGRGIARVVHAAWKQWLELEDEDGKKTATSSAIANTFTDKNGNFSWQK